MATRRPTPSDDTTLTLDPSDGQDVEARSEDQTTEYVKGTLEDEVDFPNKREREEEESFFGVWSPEVAESKGLKALLYGPAGSGKTWLAATFPKPLFLDLEGGMRTVLQQHEVLRYPKDPKKEITNMNQVRKFYSLVSTDENPQYETIVIDSLNELQLLVQAEVLGKYKDTNRQYDDQMTLQDYGKVNRVFLNTIRGFLKLPYHIVLTAVETPREWEGQQVYPKFTGKGIWPELQRVMEQIGYLQVRKGDSGKMEHVVSFSLSETWIAKDRLGIRQRFIPNDFEAILAAVPQERVYKS